MSAAAGCADAAESPAGTAARLQGRTRRVAPPLWPLAAAARGAALFFGAFTLLSLFGARRAADSGFDPTIWWIALPAGVGRGAGEALLAGAGALLLAYALAPRLRAWRRWATAAVALALALCALANAADFYRVWGAGAIAPSVPLPLSFVLAAVLVAVAAAVVWAPPPQGARRGRAGAVAVAAAAVCALLFPLAQVFFFGGTDYRRAADVAVVFGAQVHDSGALSTSLHDRMTTAVGLYEAGLVTKLLVSGAVGASGHDEALVMRDFAVAQGVPAEDVIIDSAGVNTEATVRNTPGLLAGLGGGGGERLTLLAVSQFYHLPRVKLTYARAGWDVLTVPARASRPIAQTPQLVVREIPAFWVYYLRAVLG